MRIVVPLLNLSMSGGVRIAIQYATGLANRNHQVTFIAPDNATSRYFSLPGNVMFIKAPVPKMGNLELGYPAISYALAKAIPECDVIFATSWQAVYPALFASRKHFKIFHLIQHDDEVIN